MDFHKTTGQKNNDFAVNSQNKTQSVSNKTDSGKSTHKIELDHLHSANITGVADVPTFTDKTVVVRLDGETLTLQGENLSVKSLDVDSGRLQISGKINTLKYASLSSPTSFAKRLLK